MENPPDTLYKHSVVRTNGQSWNTVFYGYEAEHHALRAQGMAEGKKETLFSVIIKVHDARSSMPLYETIKRYLKVE